MSTRPSPPHTQYFAAAAKPTRNLFDPWNSSSTGHQRAENYLSRSKSWRESQSSKLGEQFRSGQHGGKRIADTVGAGSEGFRNDGRLENGGWIKGTKGLRYRAQMDLMESWGARAVKPTQSLRTIQCEDKQRGIEVEDGKMLQVEAEVVPQLPTKKGIFKNLRVYINGSTSPLISDHKLKRLLAEHGAKLSIVLGRRTVTHVILGNPNGQVGSTGGAGGGLASTKIQKEIANVRGKGIKFVSVEWILESVRAGKRLPEARFANLKLAPKGQKCVLEILKTKDGAKTATAAELRSVLQVPHGDSHG